ncbi:MAG: glutathione ABC transporter permease GsiC [Candidatus Parabeggiatoa sp. nov. 3]|nr:MAG: glutathione ABC transporter permease GsiC [Gammaproteobacteria bacterium]RKZ63093.1 MAG: glutathione ABC transporter permease GsiC [Gammaproteobacteria bacterium]RKZ80564.1 MAG: glutathione ABC transporter permease GsiC [Gammaproteobacteria bacterium]
MLSFLFSRLLSTVIVVLGVVTIVFLLIHLVPGDPVQAMLGESAQPTDLEALREALGLNQPLIMQWWHYMTGLLQGDLGESLYSKEPIIDILIERFPATLELAFAGLCIAVLIALPLGSIAALRKDSIWDNGSMVFSLLGVSIPNFWLGPMLILLFSLTLGWFPVSGREGPLSLVLPALTLGTALAAILARMVRSTLLEVLNEDYIRTARAKGLRESAVVIHHALRNAALPIITVLGLQLGTLLGGAVITEIIFAWPGIGQLTIDAIHRRDYPVVQACILLISLSYVLVNTLTDIVYAWLDPRVRYSV